MTEAKTRRPGPVTLIVGVTVLFLIVLVIGYALTPRKGTASPGAPAPAAVPYSDEALYTALKTRTDCPGLLDDFNKASRDRERAANGSQERRWAGEYWVAVGARVAELHCASR